MDQKDPMAEAHFAERRANSPGVDLGTQSRM